ncbi:hypothetical protein NDU88_008765 [Pleurodeles waltl]|uniref:Uncharacterized protein n=1 Tax=Pleurodeles waltl TaxID=8319 RepID=A0AAV7P1V4_PLEWA|nr:hypothetical protein NDU88_008765 [Pleurodeles waltl]
MELWSRVAVWVLCASLLHQGQGEKPPGPPETEESAIAGKQGPLGHGKVGWMAEAWHNAGLQPGYPCHRLVTEHVVTVELLAGARNELSAGHVVAK